MVYQQLSDRRRVPERPGAGKASGKARITGILGGRKFTCDVVVKNKPDRMALNYNKVIDYIEKHGKKIRMETVY